MYEYILNEEEKNYVMLLKKEDELIQNKIVKKTSIARNTVSRRLDNLEKICIVKRCYTLCDR